MITAILESAPAQSGKDTAAAHIESLYPGRVVHLKVAAAVKDRVHRRLGLDVPHDAFEGVKDTPRPEFGGQTPRQAYIAEGAKMIAEGGPEAVVGLLRPQIEALPDGAVVVVSDLKDDMEARYIAGLVDSALLLRIHRPGRTFDGDCRSWIRIPEIPSDDIDNIELPLFLAFVGQAVIDHVDRRH